MKKENESDCWYENGVVKVRVDIPTKDGGIVSEVFEVMSDMSNEEFERLKDSFCLGLKKYAAGIIEAVLRNKAIL